MDVVRFCFSNSVLIGLFIIQAYLIGSSWAQLSIPINKITLLVLECKVRIGDFSPQFNLFRLRILNLTQPITCIETISTHTIRVEHKCFMPCKIGISKKKKFFFQYIIMIWLNYIPNSSKIFIKIPKNIFFTESKNQNKLNI